MEGEYCSDCKGVTTVVIDRSSGDTICMECGLVLASHLIEETSEWRTFANVGFTDHDPVRVGDATNPFLAEIGPSTFTNITNTKDQDSLPHRHALVDNPSHSLQIAFNSISNMSDRLGLSTKNKDSACEIYKKMNDLKCIKRKNENAMFAACLYIACRKENTPRTVKEIASVVDGANKNDIGRAKEYILKKLGEELGGVREIGSVNAADFIRRFCSTLGMTNLEMNAAHEAIKNSEALDIRRSPLSIAAAIIYMISQLSGNERSSKDISIVTGVAEVTLKSAYKDLSPHASRLIPSSFASEEQLKTLHRK